MATMPERLKCGDLIRIVSPAYPALPRIRRTRTRAEQALLNMGFNVDYSENAFECVGQTGGTALQRADDINSAFSDGCVSGVICALGGADSMDVLPYLDFEVIKNNPKIFVGHSSNAVLLISVYAMTGCVTFHGPCFVNHFGEYPSPLEETLKYFRWACCESGELSLRPMAVRTDQVHCWWYDPNESLPREFNLSGGWRWLKDGMGEGVLVGGALYHLINVLSSPWTVSLDGVILFTDVDQSINPAVTDALLSELDRRFDIFKKIVGLVVGVPSRYSIPKNVAALEEVVMKWASKIDGPILMDADCGHTDPVWTIPIGARGKIDSYNDSFVCRYGVKGVD